MIYQEFLTENFFSQIATEKDAIEALWLMKFESAGFRCSAPSYELTKGCLGQMVTLGSQKKFQM